MSQTAIITTVHGRHEHLQNQRRGLEISTRTDFTWIVVAMDDPALTSWSPRTPMSYQVVHHPTSPLGLPLGAARNVGARLALQGGASTLIFLDIDCIPDANLVDVYCEALQLEACTNSVLCGTVCYLPPPPEGGYRLGSFAGHAVPHPARPTPASGEILHGADPNLFWSLSFAVSSRTWQRIGGFCEDYVGYGGEDTDFAYHAHAHGFDIAWLGGAQAFHQYHPTEDPPSQHVVDIVRNARLFHSRWDVWPMTGWLDAFVEQGLVGRTPTDYRLIPESTQ